MPLPIEHVARAADRAVAGAVARDAERRTAVAERRAELAILVEAVAVEDDVAVVGIEFGFLLVYRSGWNLGIAAVLVNVVASLILLPVAIFLFKDKISWINIAGIVVCLLGLIMLNWKR